MTAAIMTQHLEIDSLGTIYRDVHGRDIKKASYILLGESHTISDKVHHDIC